MHLFYFAAASFHPFKLGSVTPKPKRRNGSTYSEQAQKRRKSYKRGTDLSNGRRRRSEGCEDSRKERKQERVATRRRQRSLAAQEDKKEEDATIKDKMIRFYKQYNPTKLDEIDGLLKKYSGRDTELFGKLVKKYCADPAMFGLDKEATSWNAAACASSTTSNNAVSGFAFGVSSTPAAFSSETFKGFGSVAVETKCGSSSFTAPTANSFSSFGKATSTLASSQSAKHVSFGFSTTSTASCFGQGSASSSSDTPFGSLAAPKTFGSIASKSATLPNGWGAFGVIRTKSSFDSEMDWN
jgi:hypothetical protein